jgi:GNAT superfamily N-acetyltransferase
MELVVRAGGVADQAVLLALFDEAVAWLGARGQTGQWGSEPFSARADMQARVHGLVTGGGLWIAEHAGAPVGALALGTAPGYAPPARRPELYINLLLTSRRFAGMGIGRSLVDFAVRQARERGAEQLRVDCWAEAAGLVRWYEDVGFERAGTFDLAGWRGQLLTMELDDAAPEQTPEEVLPGGVANAGAVIRVANSVVRPASPHAASIHELLARLRDNGFAGGPLPLGFEADGRERLSFIPGEVPRRPLPAWWWTDRALASVAALLRRYHDIAATFVPQPDATWSSELADPRGGTLICHNDICPENLVFQDGTAIAVIDFDFAAPGRAVYDLAQLAKMCVPLCAPSDAAQRDGSPLDIFARLRVVADAYRLPPDRTAFVEAIDDALAVGDRFVKARVAAGEAAFVEMWAQRGGDDYARRRRAWYDAHRDELLDAVHAAK